MTIGMGILARGARPVKGPIGVSREGATTVIATFRPRKSDLYPALGMAPLFLAWGGALLWLAANDPAIRSPTGFAAMSLIPFFMAGLCAWMTLNFFRSSLRFRAGRVIFQGVVKRVEMDLGDVTEARWGPGGVVKLRDAANRLTIRFAEYEKEDREPIVAHLHATIRPEVQQGWNLYAYKSRFGLPEKRTPGPGEVLRTRRDSRRLYLAVVAASVPLVVAVWWLTGHASTLFVIPALVAVALGFGYATPKGGEVVPEISWRATPEVGFILAWAVVGCGLILGFDRLWHALPIPIVPAAATGAAYVAVFIVTMNRAERRRRARDAKAAEEAAAAERAEKGFPPGDARL